MGEKTNRIIHRVHSFNLGGEKILLKNSSSGLRAIIKVRTKVPVLALKCLIKLKWKISQECSYFRASWLQNLLKLM